MKSLIAIFLAAASVGQAEPARRTRAGTKRPGSLQRLLGEPRNAVLFVLGAVVILGGGRRLLTAWRGREALAKLDDPEVTPNAVERVVDYGRAGLMDLFRLLEKAPDQAIRDAAGHAISILWARDELIAEEEKALVRRGFRVEWIARRRYPRGLHRPIPIRVNFGVPFLQEDGPGVRPEQLEWSYRIAGARRASLEVDGPWVAGPGVATFALIPADFDTDGPHKLVLQSRVRTRNLTETWEIELPHIPFSFELDPRLDVEAILAMSDDSRALEMEASVRLVPPDLDRVGRVPRFFPINAELAVRDLPSLEVSGRLPCDLAHEVELEFEGVSERLPAGQINAHGQASDAAHLKPIREFPLGRNGVEAKLAIERPGARKIRARLIPDPDHGWADPDVRSLWPRAIETDWITVEIVRR